MPRCQIHAPNTPPFSDGPPSPFPTEPRVAVWFIINVEEWDINQPMARTVLPSPQGAAVSPDIPNYSWFDYGMRVGFWRLQRALSDFNLPCTISLNASVCEYYPELVQSCLDRQWELLAHGYIQQVLHKEPDERATIRKTIEVIREFSGSPPRGWMGPGLAETFDTPDILAEEGIEYIADWVNDDQPYELKVKSGRMVALPYTVELNDIPIYLVQHHSRSRTVPPRQGLAGNPARRGIGKRARNGHLHAPLHHRRRTPHRTLPASARVHNPAGRRFFLDRHRYPGLVQRAGSR